MHLNAHLQVFHFDPGLQPTSSAHHVLGVQKIKHSLMSPTTATTNTKKINKMSTIGFTDDFQRSKIQGETKVYAAIR